MQIWKKRMTIVEKKFLSQFSPSNTLLERSIADNPVISNRVGALEHNRWIYVMMPKLMRQTLQT
jgi:hypothetical protein